MLFVVFSAEEARRVEYRARLSLCRIHSGYHFLYGRIRKATTTVPELSPLSLLDGKDATLLQGRFLLVR